MKDLTKKERMYAKVIKTGKVLYIKGVPGIGKSAIFKSIADKLNWNYIDVRLSHHVESDFAFPTIVTEDGRKFVDYIPPLFLKKANEGPTLIHFEESNRCRKEVQNVMLQILHDRRIGDFKFNDDVYFVMSGNLGDEDGNSEVVPFSTALVNRIITIKHEMSYDDWVEAYAKDNVDERIVEFLKHNRGHYLNVNTNDDEEAWPSPRSWSNLSDIIKDMDVNDTLDFLENFGGGIIGKKANVSFINYVNELKSISVDDVIKGKITESQYREMNGSRIKISKVLGDLSKMDLDKVNIDNVIKFLKNIDHPDEIMGFLLTVLDNDNGETPKQSTVKLFRAFPDFKERIQNSENI